MHNNVNSSGLIVSLTLIVSDCPEDCRESVSSLMFAAARFSDLPELRDLRQTFQERYGDSLEYFLNKEVNLAPFFDSLILKMLIMHNINSVCAVC